MTIKADSKTTSEREYYWVDFKDRLGVGVQIVSCTCTCEVKSGIDASAAAMASGPVVISGTKVLQLIINGVNGNGYELHFKPVTNETTPQTLEECLTFKVKDC